jgi:hypothetical protein
MDAVLCPRLFVAMTMSTVVLTDIPVTFLNKSVTKEMENLLIGQEK